MDPARAAREAGESADALAEQTKTAEQRTAAAEQGREAVQAGPSGYRANLEETTTQRAVAVAGVEDLTRQLEQARGSIDEQTARGDELTERLHIQSGLARLGDGQIAGHQLHVDLRAVVYPAARAW